MALLLFKALAALMWWSPNPHSQYWLRTKYCHCSGAHTAIGSHAPPTILLCCKHRFTIIRTSHNERCVSSMNYSAPPRKIIVAVRNSLYLSLPTQNTQNQWKTFVSETNRFVSPQTCRSCPGHPCSNRSNWSEWPQWRCRPSSVHSRAHCPHKTGRGPQSIAWSNRQWLTYSKSPLPLTWQWCPIYYK